MKPVDLPLVALIINNLIQLIHANINPACKCVKYESLTKTRGIFTSPNHPEIYETDQNCILYQFVGDLGEIVELTFLEFDVKPPYSSKQCTDYLRFFLDLERPEVNEKDEYQYEMCGNITMIRKKHYSSSRSLIFEFHTDSVQGNHTGFRGAFRFLQQSSFITKGCTRQPGSTCKYDCYSGSSKKGTFFSPRYPQNYRPGTKCTYAFHGKQNESVNLVFQNIQLEEIDGSCKDSPDVIRVHDGSTYDSPVIAEYCKTLNKRRVYSSGSDLFVELTTDGKKQSQGFAATFEFVQRSRTTTTPTMVTPSATPPGHIQDKPGPGVANGNNHTLNKNCDMDFYSHQTINGTFSSPGFPKRYPGNQQCTYSFHGQGRQRVQIKFVYFNLNYEHGDDSQPSSCEGVDTVTASLTINDAAVDLGMYCGTQMPPMLMSNSPTMKVTFNAHSHGGEGFDALFRFVENFGIEDGEQDLNEVCSFRFDGKKTRNGTFHSPNYQGLYPRDTECHYFFSGEKKDRVEIEFPFLNVEGIPPGCDQKTSSDYIEFSNFEGRDRLMERFCGQEAKKKKIISDNYYFRVTFKSNHIYDGYGFQAYYQFKSYDDVPDTRKDNQIKHPDPVTSVSMTTRSNIFIFIIISIISIL